MPTTAARSVSNSQASADNRKPATLNRLFRSRGVWALGDQAILSLGNFLTNYILINAWTDKTVYGTYSLLLTFILFLNNLHMSLVTYPLSVTAAGDDDAAFLHRTRRALVLTLFLNTPAVIALCIGTACTTSAWLIFPVVFALVLWQIQETLRRAMMARLQHPRAVPGDVISYLLQAAAIWAVARFWHITVAWAFLLVGGSSLLALIVQSAQLGLFRAPPASVRPDPGWRHQTSRHWHLGKWLLLSNIVNVVSTYAAPWVLAYSHGKGDFALLGAVTLLMNASNPVLSSLAGLITPAVAHAVAPKQNEPSQQPSSRQQAIKIAAKYALPGILILTPFFGTMLLLPGTVLHLVYRKHPDFQTLATPLRLFAAAYAALFLSAMLIAYVCGLGKSRYSFYAQSVNAIVMLGLTLPLTIKFGVVGIAAGMLVQNLAQLATAGICMATAVWSGDRATSPILSTS